MQEYYVYKHTTPSNKIYIGITRQNPKRRWKYGEGYIGNSYFYNAIQKYGWNNIKHEILFDGLSKEEAEQKEIELIAYYQSNNRSFGYNIENGGHCIGTHSDETKRKISKGNKGKIISRETRKKMSDSESGNKHWNYGNNHSKETRKKMSDSHKGKVFTKNNCKNIGISHKKSILQFSQNNEFLRIWDSATDVERETAILRQSIISCCKGKSKTAGGYIWRYAQEGVM